MIADDDVERANAKPCQSSDKVGVEVRDAYEQPYSLEDVFIVVVEKARQQGKVAKED